VSYEASGGWRAATLAYAEAEANAPSEDVYTSRLGFALLGQARQTDQADWERRHALLRESLVALRRARRLNPANLDHARNLAKLHHAWSMLDPDAERARRHRNTAESIYQQLAVAMPHNAGLMNEWATLYLDHGDLQAAIARLDDSVRIDGSYFTTHWLRGNVLMQARSFDEALAAYERTLQVSPNLPAAMSGKTLALAALGRLEEAIRVSQQAVDRDGSDLISRRNLITLLQRTGNRERALEQARAALPHASGDDALQLRELIAQLELGAGGQAPGAGSTDPEPIPGS
jgi:tetratricopeptide (TPR) repeat protein